MTYSFGSNAMFVAQGAFFAQIADERMGGSYLTLLNTLVSSAEQENVRTSKAVSVFGGFSQILVEHGQS